MAYKSVAFLNTDKPVGPSKANAPDDVRLVQSLLLGVRSSGDWTPPPPGTIAVDGQFTPTLGAWIKSFQSLIAARNPGKFVVDGVVDPMRIVKQGDWSSSFVNGAGSCLYMMNRITWITNARTHQQTGEVLRLEERLS